MRWAILTAICLAGLAAQVGAETTIEASKTKLGKYEKIEFTLRLDERFRDPFDPDEAAVELRLKAPGGRILAIPAFWCQQYERKPIARSGRPGDWMYPVGEPVWKARFAPVDVGRYEAWIEVARPGAAMKSKASVAFECAPSDRKGFLRTSTADPRYLETTEGQPFFAIGQNLAFIGEGQYVTLSRAEQIFGKLSQNGANFLRIWTGCEDWAMAVEARKSAWTRSWGGKPPLVPMPGAADGRKCVSVGEGGAPQVSISPSHPVAVRPETRYVFSGKVNGTARLRVELGRSDAKEGFGSGADGQWTAFRQEFTTAGSQDFLEHIVLRREGTGTLLVDALSLREAAGGPELLWEADPNRPIFGQFNPLDCFMLDQVVEAAERNGLYLQLCLFARDQYMRMLKNDPSAEYDEAIRHGRRFLRHAVARWGYSTSVGAWEYFNEIDPGLPTDRFYQELGEYLEAIDVYRHLRTTSTWSPSPKDWRHPKLDIAEMHHYLRPANGQEWKDETAVLAAKAQILREKTPRGPYIMGEFGLADDKWGLSPYMKQDRELVHFHNSLWASAMSGSCGTALFWWWDTLDQQEDAYRHYRPLAKFTAGVPWNKAGFQPIALKVSDERLRAMAIRGKDPVYGKDLVCLWLFDPQAAWWSTVVDKVQPAEHRQLTLEIPVVQSGRHRVRWWYTDDEKTLSPDQVKATVLTIQRSQDGALRLTPPPFKRDIACKIEPGRGDD